MIGRTNTLSERSTVVQRQALPIQESNENPNPRATLRIGAVSYLNSKPLVEGLAALLPEMSVQLDFPSRLADELTAGKLDVALIPSIEYFRGTGYQIISDACVAAHGPVLSVKLYSRVPWENVQTLALDEGSRTSATLARILLNERYGVTPALRPLPIDRKIEETDADAILLIGDRAILPPKQTFCGTWDLGEEWFRWTGLPFVFAMWVCKPRAETSPERFATDVNAVRSAQLDEVKSALERARDHGAAHLDEIARREAPLLGLSYSTTYSYLSENLQYHLGGAERSGLKLFYELATGMGLAPEGQSLEFRSTGKGH